MATPDRNKFKVGDYVRKHEGYNFQGEIRAVYTTRLGYTRYVVEVIYPGFEGWQHIFNEDQLIPWKLQHRE